MGAKPKRKSRIAIPTGGGDVPGLNPCIKTLVSRADSEGIDVMGVRRGWAGLLEYNPDAPDDSGMNFNCVQVLTPKLVRTIDCTGGTYLHTSRTNPSTVKKKGVPDFLKQQLKDDEEVKDLAANVLKNIEHLNMDANIPIGGNDTLSFAERLHQEGVSFIAIPKTMDNDVFGRLVALSCGLYTDVPLSTIMAGQKRVDVRELYDEEAYRPKVRHAGGKPMFLY